MLANKQPVKRLLVRNFKGQKLPDSFESNSWEVVKQGITAIMNGVPPQNCLEVLYKTVENMVRSNLGGSLYSKVYEEIEGFNKTFGQSHASELLSKEGADVLSAVASLWKLYTERLCVVENVLMYLDRCHVLARPELIGIHDLGVSMFKNYMLESTSLFETIEKALLRSILEVRSSRGLGEVALQRCLIEMLVDMNLFGRFEALLLDHSQRQFNEMVASVNFASYQQVGLLTFVLLFEERLMASIGVPKETLNKMVKLAEQILLLNNLEQIVASGLGVMIQAYWAQSALEIAEPPMNDFGELQRASGDAALHDLRLLVKLAIRGNGLEVMKAEWIKFIKSHGSSILASSPEASMIDDILGFKERLEALVSSLFNMDPLMMNALKEAFESFTNARQTRLAELIAKYLDGLLRDGKPHSAASRMPDEQLKEVIGQVIPLFRFLQSKDAVEHVYKALLAKRLLQNRSVSMALEKDVVARFKAECGAAFTSRLEGMFKDIEAVPDTNRAFRAAAKLPDDVDFGVTVISSGIWPHPDPAVDIRLPSFVTAAQGAFEGYYDSKHSGRKLVWAQNMGHCVVKAHFPQGAKELQVSIPQAMVLAAFNDKESLSVAEVMKASGQSMAEACKTLDSLATGKHRILTGSGHSRTDTYTFNRDFTSRLVRIRLNSSAEGVAVAVEPTALSGQQLDDRQHQIDAAIVRTIKARRTMHRPDLIQHSLDALKLPIPSAEVDKRIDVLITRDFIVKDSTDPQLLVYVP